MASTGVKGAEVVKPEVKEDNKEVGQGTTDPHLKGTTDPPLKYKTWVLRVSIHCEGCKRKMKKILHSVDGVYTTEIDLRQQKVTVNGDVEADTLIKRLAKMGRHAELWPLKDNKQQGKSKSKDKHGEHDSSGEEGENTGGGEGEKGNAKGEEKAADTGKKGPEAGALPTKNGVVAQIKEVNGEVKHMVQLPTGYSVPVFEGEGSVEKTGASSGGGKKKKKKKKGNKGGGTSNNNDEEGPPCGREHAYDAPGRGVMFHPASMSPPRHLPYQFPPQTYYVEPPPPPPPVCTFGCHTSHPSSSYGTSYYSPQPHSHAYAYDHHFSPESEHVLSDLKMCSSPAAETFHILSEENPHACLVM